MITAENNKNNTKIYSLFTPLVHQDGYKNYIWLILKNETRKNVENHKNKFFQRDDEIVYIIEHEKLYEDNERKFTVEEYELLLKKLEVNI